MAQTTDTGFRTFAAPAGAIAQYLRVKPSGTTVVVAGASDREIGVLTKGCFASGADPVTVQLTTAVGTVNMVASGAIAVNSLVYPDAGGYVTGTANGLPIGYALVAASANNDVIEVLRVSNATGGGKLLVSTAASTAVTNTTTETLFSNSVTVPANMLVAGDRLRIKFQGIATATNSTDTLAIKLYIGGLTGTALLSLAARDVANNDIFYGEAEVVIRTAGAGGTFVATGATFASPNAQGTALVGYSVPSTAIDTTAAQVIGVSATWSVANAGDSCRLDILNVDRVAA